MLFWAKNTSVTPGHNVPCFDYEACGGFQAIEHVAEVLMEVILDKRTGFQFHGTDVTDGTQLCGKENSHEVTGNLRLRQKLAKCGIMGSWCTIFILHCLNFHNLALIYLIRMAVRQFKSNEK